MSTPILSVRQPWADLILRGIKDVENRSWTTHYRGPLNIHAGKSLENCSKSIAFLREECEITIDPDSLVRGRILGTVDLVEIYDWHGSDWWDGEGYAWVLANPRFLPQEEQLEIPGRLGLFYL